MNYTNQPVSDSRPLVLSSQAKKWVVFRFRFILKRNISCLLKLGAKGTELWESESVTIGLSHGLVMIGTGDTCVSVKVCVRDDF